MYGSVAFAIAFIATTFLVGPISFFRVSSWWFFVMATFGMVETGMNAERNSSEEPIPLTGFRKSSARFSETGSKLAL